MPRSPGHLMDCCAVFFGHRAIFRARRRRGVDIIAVDMTEGKIRWHVPLGSMQDFGGKSRPLLLDQSAGVVPLPQREDWSSSPVPSIRLFGPATWRLGRK